VIVPPEDGVINVTLQSVPYRIDPPRASACLKADDEQSLRILPVEAERAWDGTVHADRVMTAILAAAAGRRRLVCPNFWRCIVASFGPYPTSWFTCKVPIGDESVADSAFDSALF